MRRPLVPILLIQCLVILILIEGFGLKLYATAFEAYYDSVEKITGRVKTVRIKEDYSALTIDMGSENLLLRLDGVTDEEYIYDLVGRSITATGKITEPDGQRNPGCFDYRQYLRARKCYAIMDVSVFKFSSGEIKNPASHLLSKLKCSFLVAAKDMMDAESFGLLFGVMFGDKAYLDDTLYESFQDNGIAHILAVSGLHVGLIYGVVKKLLKRKDRATALLSIAFLFVYAALSDFSISVIRAGVMIALSIIAFQIRKRYDMLSAACFVAMLLLMINPYYIYDSGAQLSFLAAYSLAVLLPWFEIKFKKYCDKIRSEKLYTVGQIFLPGIVLQIGMLPLMAYHFMNVSLLSIFINPIAIYLTSLLLPAGLVCFIIHPVKILLAGGCSICTALCKLLILLARLSDIIGGITVPAPTFSLLALYYLLLFYLFSENRIVLLRKGMQIHAIAAGAFLTLFACIMPWVVGISQSVLPWKYNSYDAVFVDVGQGDCIHLQSDGVNVLVDGGGSYYKDVATDILQPYLLKQGITKIDLAIVTHLDSDHSKGIADLSQMMKIETIVFPSTAMGEDLSAFNTDNICFASAGDIISFGDGSLQLLAPAKDEKRSLESNESALVSLCTVNGVKLLLMSDITKEMEEDISWPKADIIKVGHHGSKTSTSEKLLEESGAGYAVISCGKNNRFGHPHESVLELLENSGIIIRRTDLEGAVLLKDGKLLEKSD